jgi:hypothetical protein
MSPNNTERRSMPWRPTKHRQMAISSATAVRCVAGRQFLAERVSTVDHHSLPRPRDPDAAILGRLLGYSYYTCSRQPKGCSVLSVVAGVVRILAKPFS